MCRRKFTTLKILVIQIFIIISNLNLNNIVIHSAHIVGKNTTIQNYEFTTIAEGVAVMFTSSPFPETLFKIQNPKIENETKNRSTSKLETSTKTSLGIQKNKENTSEIHQTTKESTVRENMPETQSTTTESIPIVTTVTIESMTEAQIANNSTTLTSSGRDETIIEEEKTNESTSVFQTTEEYITETQITTTESIPIVTTIDTESTTETHKANDSTTSTTSSSGGTNESTKTFETTLENMSETQITTTESIAIVTTIDTESTTEIHNANNSTTSTAPSSDQTNEFTLTFKTTMENRTETQIATTESIPTITTTTSGSRAETGSTNDFSAPTTQSSDGTTMTAVFITEITSVVSNNPETSDIGTEISSTTIMPTETSTSPTETTTIFEPSEDNCRDTVEIKEIVIKIITSESFEIEWTTTDNYKNCVEKVNLRWTDDDKHEHYKELDFENNTSSYNITDLDPCRKYNIEINLMGPAGKFTVDKDKIDGETESVIPTAVELNVQPKVNSIDLSWSPNEKDQYCIIAYNITYYPFENSEEKTISVENEIEKYSINDLRPCTKYNIKIFPIGKNNQCGTETIKQERTLSEAPSNVNLNLTTEENTIRLTWSKPDRGIECLEGYQIAYKLHHEENYEIIDEIIDKNENTYLIEKLKYCNEYDIYLLPIGEEKNGTVIKGSTQTFFAAPSEVENLKLTIENGNNIRVEWEEPKTAPECVTIYQIKCYISKDQKPTVDNATVSPYVFETLEFCSEYEIEIQPLGEQNNNGPSSLDVIETNSTDIDEVSSLESKSTSNTIFVEWKVPKEVACVESYTITCRDKKTDDIQQNITNELNFEFINLEPCVEYDIMVQANPKHNKQSKPRSTVSTTLASQPSKVTEINVEQLEFALNISWKPPEIAMYCVHTYEIKLHENGTDTIETTESLSKLIRNLVACREYDFTITPIVSDDMKGNSNSGKGSTLPSVTNAPILREAIPKQKSADFRYEVEISNNECELKITTTICKSNIAGDEEISVDVPFKPKIEGSTPNEGSHYFNFPITIDNLKPFTNYTCTTRIKNIHGHSEESSTQIKTLADVPSKPILKNPSQLDQNSFTIEWEKPESIPGENYSTTLEIHEIGPKFNIPPECEHPPEKPLFTTNLTDDKLSFRYNDALPYTEYKIQIFGRTEAGEGPKDQKTIVTNPDAPSEVRDVEVKITYTEEKNTSYPYTIQLTWVNPCNISGVLHEFRIKIDGNIFLNHMVTDNATTHMVLLEKLQAQRFYEAEIFAINESPSSDSLISKGSSFTFSTPSGVPSYIAEYEKKMHVSPGTTNNPEHKAELKFSRDLFSDEMGRIKFYSVIIAQDGFEGYQKFESWNDTGDNWIKAEKWSKNPKLPYQATDRRWNPFTDNKKEYTLYIIGSSTCKDVNDDDFCNGPLSPNTKYSVRIRGFTTNGYSDTPSIKFQTAVAFNVGVIIAIIISLFIFGTCLSFAIYFKNGNASIWVKSICLCKDMSNSVSQSTVMPPRISVQNFPAHCMMLRSNENQLSSEFSLLETLSDDIALLTYIGDLPHNRVKNRYPNIKPYDVTRVKLRVVPDEFSDYINASYIKGYNSDVEYIATQGPKEETIDDFWQMVYENDVKQIVMVTNLTEKGKSKCYKYYPEEFDPVTCSNGIELECEFIEFKHAYTMRHISLKKKNQPYVTERKVVHLQFHEWPDFGVPQNTDSVLKLCREIRSMQAQNYGVIAVHCSAGVGRTGTIIAIDILVQAIHANRKIDVFGTVFSLRKQRQHMVKTQGQYAFIYNCLRDEILNPQVFKGADRYSSYTSFYDRGYYYNFNDDGDIRKLSTESVM